MLSTIEFGGNWRAVALRGQTLACCMGSSSRRLTTKVKLGALRLGRLECLMLETGNTIERER